MCHNIGVNYISTTNSNDLDEWDIMVKIFSLLKQLNCPNMETSAWTKHCIQQVVKNTPAKHGYTSKQIVTDNTISP